MIIIVLAAVLQGCHNPTILPTPAVGETKLSDRVLVERFDMVTNGMSKDTVLKILGIPTDSKGNSLRWVGYDGPETGQSLTVMFADSTATNVARHSWIEGHPIKE